jgi:hypothetical protein
MCAARMHCLRAAAAYSIFTDRAISYRIDNGFDHFTGPRDVKLR